MAESERDTMINQKNALEEAMKQLEGIVEREYNLGHIENKGNFWESIERVINGTNRDERINIKIDENIKNELLDRIEEKVTIEKQQLYYEQVRRFTNDFSFLSEYSEVAKARGVQLKKFTDEESYRRFLGLQSLVHRGADEYTQIVSLLERDGVEEVNRRILEARKCVIDKEMNRQSTEILR